MLHFCIELNIIGPVDKNARFDERPIARIFIVNNDWVLLILKSTFLASVHQMHNQIVRS